MEGAGDLGGGVVPLLMVFGKDWPDGSLLFSMLLEHHHGLTGRCCWVGGWADGTGVVWLFLVEFRVGIWNFGLTLLAPSMLSLLPLCLPPCMCVPG